MSRPKWVPAGTDTDKPNAARVYDYYLGGSHNFAVDREMARKAVALWPDLPMIMRANRAFLRRAVHFAAEQGVTRFLDIGSGIPTFGAVHEVAREVAPAARVVYVDRDPVAVAHTRQILAGNVNAGVLLADLRAPAAILESPEVNGLLDLGEPVAVLMISVLHFVADEEDPAGITAHFRDALAPGSMLAIAHGSRDTEGMPSDHLHSARDAYQERVAQVTLRTRREVEALFAGFRLVEPGVVWLTQWRPESPQPREATEVLTPQAGYGGVGVKR